MVMRYLPFALIWIIGLPFLIWVLVAPNVADLRFWQVDAVSVKMGSSQVANPADQQSLAPAPPADPTAPSQPSTVVPPAPTQDVPLSTSEWPDDGVKIKVISPDLQEQGTHGAIPKIGADGTKPWQYYARPFPLENTEPRLAIIMRDIGLSDGATTEAIRNLPGEVTLAFSPYADNLAQKMQAARDRGHETLLLLPLEMQPGSTEDVGPRAYSAQQTPAVNQDNFAFMLSNLLGSVGIITDGGQRFVNNETMLRPLMQNLSDRGLVFVDDTMQTETLSPLLAEQMKAPWARTLIKLDENLSPDALDVAMGKAAQLAKQNGRALVVTGSSPLARSVIAKWAHRLQRDGVALAPLTSIVTIGSAAQPAAATAAPSDAMPAAAQPLAPPADTINNDTAPAADTNTGTINLLSDTGNAATAPNILNPGIAAGRKQPENLLNPTSPGGAPANVLDPSKPAAAKN